MRAQRKGLTVIEFLFVVTVVAIDIGLIAPGVQRALQASAQPKCQVVQPQIERTMSDLPSPGSPQPSTPAKEPLQSQPDERPGANMPKRQSDKETVSTAHDLADH